MSYTQKDTNPYKYSDSNKRYQTFDYFLKRTFGMKCAKISLDAGFTCPNIDGTKGVGGCIYCSSGSSGAACEGTIEQQYDAGVKAASSKWRAGGYIPYLQAHTNTYGDAPKLRELYFRCARLPGAVMLAIATRADCLGRDVVEVIKEVSEAIPVTVELGLQSIHDGTAELINRCHTFAEFLDGYERLRNAGGNIYTCIHLINGLPGEDTADMLSSAARIAELEPDMVKLHLQYVLRGTVLSEMYERGDYIPLTLEEYVSTVCSQLEILPEKTVIARVTGDAVQSELISPAWSRRKTVVANEIDKELYRRNTWQGCRYKI